MTVTLCLPLFLSGNEGERNFAKTHPTITIDGCEKQCARWGTEKHSGPVSGALIVSEILGTQPSACHRSSRGASQADREAVWAVAEQIAAAVDRALADATPAHAVAAGMGAGQCACSSPVPGGSITVKGAKVMIAGLPLIFEQCAERSFPADDSGSTALLEVVKIYHHILPEEEADYRRALLAAYQDFRCRAKLT